MPFGPPRKKIAVAGGGVAGLSCAWLLGQAHDVTLYDAAPRLGGHCHTVDVPDAGPVDMGFIVYNESTYPNLVALFNHLGVPSQATEMSFGVSLRGGKFEYAGSDLGGLFAQGSNVFSPRFWSMLFDLVRFYRQAPRDAAALERDLIPLDQYLRAKGFGDAFMRDHLYPMAAAIWSTPADQVGAYPAAAFIRFCENHGLLKLINRPVWRTVTGGSQVYVNKLQQHFNGTLRSDCAVLRVERQPGVVTVSDSQHGSEDYDEIVIAAHAPQALAMLADPSDAERNLLGSMRCANHQVVMHRDERFMPRRKRAWSSWNYSDGNSNLALTYWMNQLQRPDTKDNIFVSLNPQMPPEGIIERKMFEHPQFDAAALRAQRALWSLQGTRNTWYCGAWFGAGFHEDGLQSGLAVAEQLGRRRRPWDVANESARIPVMVPA